MWGELAIVAAGMAHSSAAATAADAQRRQYEMNIRNMAPFISAPKPAKAVAHGKCHSCGSRQFKEHRSVLVCSYCRSEQ